MLLVVYYNMQRIPVAVQVVSCISADVATADQFNFKLFTIHKCGEEHVCMYLEHICIRTSLKEPELYFMGLSSGPSENKDLNGPRIITVPVTFPYGLRINVKTQNTANFITFKPKVFLNPFLSM